MISERRANKMLLKRSLCISQTRPSTHAKQARWCCRKRSRRIPPLDFLVWHESKDVDGLLLQLNFSSCTWCSSFSKTMHSSTLSFVPHAGILLIKFNAVRVPRFPYPEGASIYLLSRWWRQSWQVRIHGKSSALENTPTV